MTYRICGSCGRTVPYRQTMFEVSELKGAQRTTSLFCQRCFRELAR